MVELRFLIVELRYLGVDWDCLKISYDFKENLKIDFHQGVNLAFVPVSLLYTLFISFGTLTLIRVRTILSWRPSWTYPRLLTPRGGRMFLTF